MIEAWAQYGILGLVIVGISSYVLVIDKGHKKERKEWAERDEKNFKRLNDISDETNKVLRENTNILTGLKTLLENRRQHER